MDNQQETKLYLNTRVDSSETTRKAPKKVEKIVQSILKFIEKKKQTKNIYIINISDNFHKIILSACLAQLA